MSGSFRWLAALGLLGLTLMGVPAYRQRTPSLAQQGINPNPFVAPGLTLGQYAYNTAVLGRALQQVPPYALGYNPYVNSVASSPALSPYSMSTVPSYNPYLGGTGSLSSSPYGGYSLSTSPSGYGSYYPGYANIPPAGAALMGYASLTAASGQYWKDLTQARVTREQYLQAQLDTARKRVEFERWYESQKLTAPQMRDREMATDLDRARKDPPLTEVWSGKALNELLRSIKNSGLTNRGPNLALDEDTLKNVNLSDNSSRGNVGMLKDGGKLSWPLSLQEPQFDEARKRLGNNLLHAVVDLKNKDPIEAGKLRTINIDFKELNTKLNDSADELSPAQYIEAKRYLNQLGAAIRALSDKNAVKYFDNTWNAKGKNVAELVSHMTKEGLQFAPATPGDEASYTSLYQSMRAFEAGVQTAQK